MTSFIPLKIISGGQTGVDRAALDAAARISVPRGDGWCPKGRLSEDGVIPAKYSLKETPTENYEERTEWNVRDSDATLILSIGELMGGTAYTIEMAKKHNKPFFICQLQDNEEQNLTKILAWSEENILVFNLIHTLSYLWVLGLFEIIRTADLEKLEKFRSKISGLRSVLAKHTVPGEPKKQKNGQKGRVFFTQAVTSKIDNRFGWEFYSAKEKANVTLTRESLSDEFLKIFNN